MILTWTWTNVRIYPKYETTAICLIRIVSPYELPDWFAAGKGPNPEVAALDKDLDAYLEKKDSEPTAIAVVEPTVGPEA